MVKTTPIPYGLLIDSKNLQAWELAIIRQLEEEGNATCVLLALNASALKVNKNRHFVYRSYRKIDRLQFKSQQDAFESSSIFSILDKNITQLTISPENVNFKYYFSETDIQAIQEHRPDLLIRFGFGILGGDILKACPMGIWSMHHGDPEFYRGGPPAFWEVMHGFPLTGGVVQQLTESLDKGKILDKFWTQTDPLSVQRNANKLFWLSVRRIPRLIRLLAHHPDLYHQETEKNLPTAKEGILYRKPDNLNMLRMWGKLWSRNTKRKWRGFFKKPQWQVWYSKNPLPKVTTIKDALPELLGKPMPGEKKSFQADPFVYVDASGTYCFYERYDFSKKKGEIAMRSIKEKEWSEPETVVEEPFHLSYPFIFDNHTETLMLVESASAHCIKVYGATDFPLKWKPKGNWLEGLFYDPTLVFKDGLYWLFAIRQSHIACSPFDELCLYYAPSLDSPDWKPHPLNPIVTDPRRARPAGRVFEQEGKWYRPAQYSHEHYGQAVVLMEIEIWDKKNYREKSTGALEGSDLGNFKGIHTLNHSGDFMVWDTFNR